MAQLLTLLGGSLFTAVEPVSVVISARLFPRVDIHYAAAGSNLCSNLRMRAYTTRVFLVLFPGTRTDCDYIQF